MSPPEWVSELISTLPGATCPVSNDRDFGGATVHQPWVLARTETRDQLVAVLRLANRHRIPVAVRGAGHSSGGQTFAASGIVVRHAPSAAQSQLSDTSIEVPGHWPWSRVEQIVRAAGRDLMVATSSLDTTVGGTLSMGGFGVRSVERGAQVDHVQELQLLCADGSVRCCSERLEPKLFQSALTGAGQVGIIERARLATAPRRPFLACCLAQHGSFRELADSIAWMGDTTSEAPHQFSALLKDGVLTSFAATAHGTAREARNALGRDWLQGAFDLTYRTSTDEAFEADERRMPLEYWWSCRNYWSDYCFDAAGFVAFVDFVDRALWEGLRGHLAYVMCVAPPRLAPLALDMRRWSDRRQFTVGLFYSVPATDLVASKAAQQSQRHALDRCLELGGRPYLYGCAGGCDGLNSRALSLIYGSSFERLARIRAQVDPRGILNPCALNYEGKGPAP
jgi:FAD/FMN-containing dehydrogenase